MYLSISVCVSFSPFLPFAKITSSSSSRKLFSKIRNNANYKPSKPTALAFAIALELDLEETRYFIGRAGYALSHSSKFDIIVEYCLTHGIYDIHQVNSILYSFDQAPLGV